MNRFVLAVLAALAAAPACAQQQAPWVSMPPNTVYGNASPIPAEPGAIPYAALSSVVLNGASGDFTCAVTGICTLAPVGNGKLATAPAWTFKGNPTSGVTNPTDFTIDGLTVKGTPAAGDEVIVWDVAGTAIKKATVSSLTSAAGVSSIAGNIGAFTLGAGLTNSTNALLVDPSFMRGYLGGLTLSGGGSTTLTINAGVACSDDFTTLMKLPSNYTKTFAAWAVGSAQGGLDTGAIAGTTLYHVYVIERPDTGVVDIAISASATTVTTGGNIPAAYTKQRRIGSIRTDATPNILAFTQTGDEFILAASLQDISTSTLTTSSSTFGTSGPPNSELLFRAAFSVASGTPAVVIRSLLENDVAPSLASGLVTQILNGSTGVGGGHLRVRLNGSSQLAARSSAASTTLTVQTYGWVDTRGRFN